MPYRVQLPHVMGSLHLQQLAGYVLVRHQSAFTLAWDGASAVYIKMSPEFLGWTHGLCGNNNADPQDDLVTSYGEVLGRWLTREFGGGGGIGQAGRGGKGLGMEFWGHGAKDPVGGQGPLPTKRVLTALDLSFLICKIVVMRISTRVEWGLNGHFASWQ